MAWTDTITLLSLAEWASILGINPWEFSQVGEGFPKPNTAQCPAVWYQYAWQQDFLSREVVAQAIAEAEAAIAQQLGYWPAPVYFTEEKRDYQRPHQRWLRDIGRTVRDEAKSVALNWSKVRTGGILTRTLIGDTANLTYSDKDADGVKDTFTASIAAPAGVTDANEIGVYFTSGDRFSETISEKWRVRPVTITISGGMISLTGHSALLVKPNLQTISNPTILNVTTATNFVNQVTVYRVYTDDTHTAATPNQGLAIWDVPPGCTGDCAVQTMPVCLFPRLSEDRTVGVGLGAISDWPYGWEPDRVQVNYLAGEPLVNNRMNPHMARIVTYLACALLPSEKCGCSESNRIIDYWRKRVEGEAGNNRPFTQRELDTNPFVTEGRGAVWAWRQVRNLADGQGVIVS